MAHPLAVEGQEALAWKSRGAAWASFLWKLLPGESRGQTLPTSKRPTRPFRKPSIVEPPWRASRHELQLTTKGPFDRPL